VLYGTINSLIIGKVGINLKNYLVFIVSFILLYTVFQLLSGVILTAFYTPDFSVIEGNLSQEVAFGETHSIPLLVILVIATTSYVLSKKLFKTI